MGLKQVALVERLTLSQRVPYRRFNTERRERGGERREEREGERGERREGERGERGYHEATADVLFCVNSDPLHVLRLGGRNTADSQCYSRLLQTSSSASPLNHGRHSYPQSIHRRTEHHTHTD